MRIGQGFNSLYIIESLGEIDGTPGAELTKRLEPTLTGKFGIPIYFRTVTTIEDLEDCLEEVYQKDAVKAVPALHFECHGSADGIELRDKSTYPWAKLANQLVRFNRASSFHTLAVFSCCEGISQIAALSSGKCCPFAALVGCEGGISTPELLEGFDRFYLTLLKSRDGFAARDALQSAVTVSAAKFGLPTAESVFVGVVQRVTAENADPALRSLRINRLRRTIDEECAKKGWKHQFTDEALEKTLLDQEGVTLRHFYERFFDVERIPSNLERYNFEALVAAARKSMI